MSLVTPCGSICGALDSLLGHCALSEISQTHYVKQKPSRKDPTHADFESRTLELELIRVLPCPKRYEGLRGIVSPRFQLLLHGPALLTSTHI